MVRAGEDDTGSSETCAQVIWWSASGRVLHPHWLTARAQLRKPQAACMWVSRADMGQVSTQHHFQIGTLGLEVGELLPALSPCLIPTLPLTDRAVILCWVGHGSAPWYQQQHSTSEDLLLLAKEFSAPGLRWLCRALACGLMRLVCLCHVGGWT